MCRVQDLYAREADVAYRRACDEGNAKHSTANPFGHARHGGATTETFLTRHEAGVI